MAERTLCAREPCSAVVVDLATTFAFLCNKLRDIELFRDEMNLNILSDKNLASSTAAVLSRNFSRFSRFAALVHRESGKRIIGNLDKNQHLYFPCHIQNFQTVSWGPPWDTLRFLDQRITGLLDIYCAFWTKGGQLWPAVNHKNHIFSWAPSQKGHLGSRVNYKNFPRRAERRKRDVVKIPKCTCMVLRHHDPIKAPQWVAISHWSRLSGPLTKKRLWNIIFKENVFVSLIDRAKNQLI